MKCYMVLFGLEIYDDFIFTDREDAEKRLQYLKEWHNLVKEIHKTTSYDYQLYVREFELVGEPKWKTMEEIPQDENTEEEMNNKVFK